MALFAYVFAFGQTNRRVRLIIDAFDSNILNWDDPQIVDGDFAARQLQYGRLLEFRAKFPKNNPEMNKNESKKSIYSLIVGDDDLERVYGEFQNYLQMKNLSNVYEFIYSIAKISCDPADQYYSTRFVRHLIRYGRVCQVCIGKGKVQYHNKSA